MDARRFSLAAFLASALLIACRRGDDGSSTAGGGSRAGNGRSGSVVPWFPGAAPLLLGPDHSPDRSLLALADTIEVDPDGALLDSIATFIRLDGTQSTGRVAITQSAEGCIEASIDPAPALAWGVGFIGGRPRPLGADSIRNMSRADSSAVAKIAFRLAGLIPGGSEGRFAGLPFSLVDLWRLKLPNEKVVLVATLRRQINQEDSPLQERTFIIAESDSTAPDGFSTRYSERSSGTEETVESRELLAAVVFPPSTSIDLILSHDFGDQTSLSIVERSADGRWTKRWGSRRFSC